MSISLKNSFLLLSCLFFYQLTFSQTVVNANQVCLGSATTLSGSFLPSDTLVNQWFWDLNNDGIFNNDSGQVIGFVFQNPDTNWISLRVTLNAGGADTLLFPVVVNPTPNVNFMVDNNCEFQQSNYIDESTISSGNITQYLWDFNNDGTVDDNSGPNVFFTVGPATTFLTRLTCVSDLGCAAFATKTTAVFPLPEASFSANDICNGDTVFFENSTTISSGVIFQSLWNFGDGNSAVTQSDVSHNYTNAGNFSSSLIVISDRDCRDTVTATITVNPLPVAFINYDPDSVIKEGESITLSISGDGSSYLWSDGSTTDNIVVSDTGSFNVLVTDNNGCSSLLSTDILFIDNLITINEIITPNQDGLNDVMEIFNIEEIGPCEVNVYNRWNNLVFSSNDYLNDWEGTNDGSALSAGTYFYTATCQGKTKVGSINILK